MSQYKDLITGDIITNIRVVDGYIVDLNGNKNKYRPFLPTDNLSWPPEPLQIASTGKFTNQSIYLNSSGLGSHRINPIIKEKFDVINPKITLSFWQNISYSQHKYPVIYFVFGNKIIQILSENFQIFNQNWELENQISVSIQTNTWIHYAIITTNSSASLYLNGIRKAYINNITPNFTKKYAYPPDIFATYNSISCIDDIVMIQNQLLWTDNFDPPNNYLTGANEKVITNRMKIAPYSEHIYKYTYDKLYCY